jgi:transposase
MEPGLHRLVKEWRTVGGDMSESEWDLIADIFVTYSGGGRMGRPTVHDKRDIVNAIFYVDATGCQWRKLPAVYPHWNTVHRYHVRWSRDGTWELVADRLRGLARLQAGHETDPSATIVDARSVRGTSMVTSTTRGYDAGKKISGRKLFGLVDTFGFPLALVVVPASVSDNAGGIAVMDLGRAKSARLIKVWCDAGFKKAFLRHCRYQGINAEVVNRIHPHTFSVLPQRWIVERTWSWIMNNRRLQVDYERHPEVTKGFVWASISRLLLHRLTTETV